MYGLFSRAQKINVRKLDFILEGNRLGMRVRTIVGVATALILFSSLAVSFNILSVASTENLEPDLSIEGIVLPYFPPTYYGYVIYPNPPLEFGYKINATVTNLGTADAGSFNVSFSVHVNEIEVPEYGRKKTILGLAQGVNETVWFYLMPESYGNYTLTIMADSDNDVAELDETNNAKTAWVIGTIRGDVDGDGKVGRYDAGTVSIYYGRRFTEPPYHPTDLDYDGDVDRYDVGVFSVNYGQTV